MAAALIANRRRFASGIVGPAGTDSAFVQTECLVRGDGRTRVAVHVRFLQIVETDAPPSPPLAPGIVRRDTVGREVIVAHYALGEFRCAGFGWPGSDARPGAPAYRQRAVAGAIALSSTPCAPGVYRLSAHLTNRAAAAADIDDALMHSLISAHTILTVSNGEWLSLIDPPPALRAEADLCLNVRTYPVLVGRPGRCDTMLSSPAIVFDYPEIEDDAADARRHPLLPQC
jgi:hydrogenase maturation protease